MNDSIYSFARVLTRPCLRHFAYANPTRTLRPLRARAHRARHFPYANPTRTPRGPYALWGQARFFGAAVSNYAPTGTPASVAAARCSWLWMTWL